MIVNTWVLWYTCVCVGPRFFGPRLHHFDVCDYDEHIKTDLTAPTYIPPFIARLHISLRPSVVKSSVYILPGYPPHTSPSQSQLNICICNDNSVRSVYLRIHFIAPQSAVAFRTFAVLRRGFDFKCVCGVIAHMHLGRHMMCDLFVFRPLVSKVVVAAHVCAKKLNLYINHKINVWCGHHIWQVGIWTAKWIYITKWRNDIRLWLLIYKYVRLAVVERSHQVCSIASRRFETDWPRQG